MNYRQWLNQAIILLETHNPAENAKVDAFCLLQFATQHSRAQIMAFDNTELDTETLQKLAALLDRRLQGEPIAYILGEKEFWSLPLFVSKETLIPRPDTEILVEKALELARHILQMHQSLHILDLGTGTGAIALALAAELQGEAKKCGANLFILGVDRIVEAVTLSQCNAIRNQLDWVQFKQSDWFNCLNPKRKFHLIVSNPPYIDQQDQHLKQGDVRFEPLSALVAEEGGYADLRRIINNAPQFLSAQGWLLLEHGWQQGNKVRSIFTENGWQNIETKRDYGNNERITLAQWNK